MGTDTIQPLSKEDRVRIYGEVFTPAHIVTKMCDMLEQENPGCFEPGTTFLEPTCGDGAFVLELLRRKFLLCSHRRDFTEALRSLYAMEIQADNVEKTIARVTELCREYFTPTKQELQIINDHVIQADSLKVMRMIADMNEREKRNQPTREA